VDVEIPRADFPYLELAAQHFTEAELASIHAKPSAYQVTQFLKIWTAKEALLKAIGLGLGIEPLAVELELSADGHPCGILRIGGGQTSAHTWSVQCETQGELVVAVVTKTSDGPPPRQPGNG
jgi:phosphopantetheinyl transferase